jgi:hypothetical protein
MNNKATHIRDQPLHRCQDNSAIPIVQGVQENVIALENDIDGDLKSLSKFRNTATNQEICQNDRIGFALLAYPIAQSDNFFSLIAIHAPKHGGRQGAEQGGGCFPGVGRELADEPW